MNSTELSESHHRQVEVLLQRLKHGVGYEPAIAGDLAALVVAHTYMEQDVLYPALRNALPEMIGELNVAIEEKRIIAVELARLLAEWTDAKAAVLSEMVLNHIGREETSIFPAAEHALGKQALNELGQAMEQRFRQTLDMGFETRLQQALDEAGAVPRAA